MNIDKEVLIQFIRMAYLHGGNSDPRDFAWCIDGSTEVAKQLFDEYCEEWRVGK